MKSAHAASRFKIPASIGSFIGGQAYVGKGERLPVMNPATAQSVTHVVEAGSQEVDAAVVSARLAFEQGPWPRSSVEHRQDVLRSIQRVLISHAEELAYLECLNTGIVLREIEQRHMRRAALNFSFFADYIGQSSDRVYRQTQGYVTSIMREPVGVAALIAPWNAPLALSSMQIASAIAFGATCVVKPSEQSPMAVALMIALLCEAGLPKGVVNLVNGRGPVTGQALVTHPGIDRVSFTGGTETGRRIMIAAAQNLVPCTLELGGKSANIIFASADLDRALDGALIGIFSNNGQQCLAGSRILVERTILDDYMNCLVARTQAIRIGDPLASTTELGPLASQAQMDRVLGFARQAPKEGCTVLVGGQAAPGFDEGYYVQPTAILAPNNHCSAARQEIFGPFATLMAFDTIDEALTMANDSEYGLASYVWSDHLPTVTHMSEGLRTGAVWVNTPMMRELRAPFGGFKNSGIGRQSGAACEAFFTEEKAITIPTKPHPLRRLGG